MKRMNEYFEMPITGIAFRGLYQAHLFCAEVDDMVAHAINNVDALADALEKLIPYCFGGNKESMSAWAEAKDALNTYRGSK